MSLCFMIFVMRLILFEMWLLTWHSVRGPWFEKLYITCFRVVFSTSIALKLSISSDLFPFSFQGIVQQFLVLLTTSSDESLQFLSFRLDFNEHYKAREPRLRVSLGTRGRRNSHIWIFFCSKHNQDRSPGSLKV